ncbi:hypothetical protein [Halorussus ruber]|uniref:hypothetical protein n=1 Tax=Halorussus ruber TaxID=1126238 RepID=UPI001091F21A|nr:hypothetical protein [Halorussus ruber]
MDLDVRYEEHDVSVVGGVTKQPSKDAPGKVQIVFSNLGESARKFQFGATPPFSPDWGTHEESSAQMILVPDLDEFEKVSVYDANDDGKLNPVPERPTDQCWQLEDMIARTDVFVAKTIPPCSSISTTYRVLGHPENESCLPPGDYRFEDSWFEGDDLEREIPLEATIQVKEE